MINNRSAIGSSLDDLLKEEGIFDEIRAAVLKEELEWQVQNSIKKTNPS